MTTDEAPIISEEQSISGIRAQVARILLEYAGNGNNGQNCLSQREIATMLSTDIYQVHSSIQSLYSEGLIRIESRRLIIKKELLKKVAGMA
jgi:DNA-binding MarR family transcriptional regulator